MGWIRLPSFQVFVVLVFALSVDRLLDRLFSPLLVSISFVDSKWFRTDFLFYIFLILGFLGFFLSWKFYDRFSRFRRGLLSFFVWMSLFLLAFVYVQYRKQAFSEHSNSITQKKDSKSEKLWYGRVVSYPVLRERHYRFFRCKKEPLKQVENRQEYWVEWHGFIENKKEPKKIESKKENKQKTKTEEILKEERKEEQKEKRVGELVLVKSTRLLRELKRGDWIVSNARIDSVLTIQPCPEFDYSRYLRDIEIDWIAYPFWKSRLEILKQENSNTLKQTIGQVHYFLLALYSRVLPTQEESQLLSALLLGRRTELSESTLLLFQQVGVNHILAISGLHVGLIASSLFIFLSLFRLPKRWIFLIISLFLILYVDLVGPKASILRAVIMFLCGVLVFLLDRNRNWWNALFLAGVVILLIYPFSLFQLSFQLSFLATLGIFLYYELILNSFSNFFYRILRLIGISKKSPELEKPEDFLEKDSSFEKKKKIQKILMQGLRIPLNLSLNLLSISLASQILTAPLLIYTFGGYSWISLFSNLFIVILAEFSVALGLFLILVSFSPFFLEVYGTSLSLSLKGILKGSQFLSENLGGYVHFDLPLWIFYLYYLVCVLIFILKNVERKVEIKKKNL